MSSHVEWKGDEIVSNMGKATALGIDQVLALCVEDAKENHTFENQTGLLEGSIQSRPAKAVGLKWVGVWGSFAVEYAIFVESGTVKLRARPFLRPAAARQYPKLPEQIRKNFEAMAA